MIWPFELNLPDRPIQPNGGGGVTPPELLELYRPGGHPRRGHASTQRLVRCFAGNTILGANLKGWLPRFGRQLEMVSGLGMACAGRERWQPQPSGNSKLDDSLLVLRRRNATLISARGAERRLCGWVAPMKAWRTPLTSGTGLQELHLDRSTQPARTWLNRRLDDNRASLKDLFGGGTTRWEALFNPQRLDLRLSGSGSPAGARKLWGGRT